MHNYNGQTPVDLAEATARDGDPRMRNYLCNLIADLQGKVPGLRSKVTVPVKRWNVSHASDFHDPNHPESGLLMDSPSTSTRTQLQEKFVFDAIEARWLRSWITDDVVFNIGFSFGVGVGVGVGVGRFFDSFGSERN